MKFEEIKKLNEKDRNKKMKELKIELVKSKTGTQKQGSSKTNKIKKIIARIHTFNNQNKSGVEKNK
jgi:ribosomal protein L29